MCKSIGAAAFVAIVFTALSASAQPSDPYDYPYCLQGKEYGLPGLCQFTSYEQRGEEFGKLVQKLKE